MQALFIIAIIAALGVAAFVIAKVRKQKSIHSSAQMLRFAASSARDVLSSNWDHDEYYARMYKYASPELASHMYKNKSLLNKVLDERAQLLGTFSEIKELELASQRFRLLPSKIFEVAATLHCLKARVPIIILVNAGKEELSLDGIRVMKKELQIKADLSKDQS